jgi:hypothetical protein
METIEINYSIPGVLLFFFLTLFVIGGFTPLLIHSIRINNQPGICFIIGWLLLYFYPATTAIKSFAAMLSGKPAIELTCTHYIDNITGITVLWPEIKNISTYRNSNLIVTVVNNAIVYDQVSNPFQKLFIWSSSWLLEPFSTNLSLVKGRNKDLVSLIKEYHQTAVKS